MRPTGRGLEARALLAAREALLRDRLAGRAEQHEPAPAGVRRRAVMIRGLSDKRRLPRLGKIRLGVTVVRGDGKSYPKATDYFVVPEIVASVLGEPRPKALPIMFPVDDVEL